MKKIWLILMLSFVLLLSACGTNYEKQLYGAWYMEEDSSPAFILYDDGTCDIAGEYGTGSWDVVNDDQFKLTNFYGESETATIIKANKETFVLTDGSEQVYFFREPKENREIEADTSKDSGRQEETKMEEALCRLTYYTDGLEDGFHEEIQIFNEKGYLIEQKDLDDEGKFSDFIQWEYDEFDNENRWVRYCVYDEKPEVLSGQEYADYESIEGGFYRKSEYYQGDEIWMIGEHFYDENHKLVEEVRYRDGEIVIRIEYIYDAKGRLTEDTWHYATGELERNVYFYEQSSDKPIYMMQYSESGELKTTCTCEYDEYGRKISVYWKDAEGRLTLKSDYDYEFDE